MKKSMYYITVIGFVLFAIGLFLIKAVTENQGILKILPYMLVGLGCGIFGHGMGAILERQAVKKSPEIKKQMDIDRKDERNIAIANQAKARAYDMMLFAYGALMMALALMGTDIAIILLLVFAYIFVVGCDIYYFRKFDKEM